MSEICLRGRPGGSWDGKGVRGGRGEGGWLIKRGNANAPLWGESGQLNGWESCYLDPKKGYTEEQLDE